MVQIQLANITSNKAKDHLKSHNSREIKPSYLMPTYYLTSEYGIDIGKAVEHIKLNDLSFDELWEKCRD